MAESAAYYEASRYRPVADEADDHFSVEAGLLSYLKMKLVFALAAGDEERAAVASGAASRVLQDHLAVFAEPEAQALESLAPEYLAHGGRIPSWSTPAISVRQIPGHPVDGLKAGLRSRQRARAKPRR